MNYMLTMAIIGARQQGFLNTPKDKDSLVIAVIKQNKLTDYIDFENGSIQEIIDTFEEHDFWKTLQESI